MLHRSFTVAALLLVALAPSRGHAQGHGGSVLAREYSFSDDTIEGELVVPTGPLGRFSTTPRCVGASTQAVTAQQAVAPPQAIPSQQIGASQQHIDVSASSSVACESGELPPDAVHAFAGDGLYRPPIEWSTWFRAAYGLASHRSPNIARAVHPIASNDEREGTWDFGLGIEASLAASKHGDVRIGAWLEQRGFSTSDTFVGGELVATRVPKRFDLFLYEGHGIASLRVGRSKTDATASLAWGYMAPYWLEGPCRDRFFGIATGVCHPRPQRLARYIAGVRVVGTFTRAIDDPSDWSATLGLEFEPVGALRANLGIRSWYRN